MVRVTLLISAALAVLAGFWLAGCSSQQSAQPGGFDPAQMRLPALPDDGKAVSTTRQVIGVDTVARGAGTSEVWPALTMDASSEGLSWAIYGFTVPEPHQLNSLSTTQLLLDGQYWIGLSDYGVSGNWKFNGPFDGNTTIDFDTDFERYISPGGNLYWAVVTAGISSVNLAYSTVDYTSQLQFRVPPEGLHTAASSPALNPSLALMPEIDGLAHEGAPVVFYDSVDGVVPTVMFAYYNGSSWEQRRFNPDGNPLSNPVAFWFGDGGLVLAFDALAGLPDPGSMVLFETDNNWEPVSSFVFQQDGGGGKPSMVAADIQPYLGGDEYILDFGYVQNGADDDQVILTHYESFINDYLSNGFVSPGKRITGLDVSMSPNLDFVDHFENAVWNYLSIDTSETFIIDSEFCHGWWDNNDVNWRYEQLDYNAPLMLDLDFTADGRPQLLMVSARDFVFDWPFPPIHFEATLFYDIALGTYSGSSWSYETLFDSDTGVDFFNTKITPNIGIDCAWAEPGGLVYTRSQGTVEFQINPEFAITGGQMTNHSHYMVDSGSGFDASGYFTGDPGVQFSWQQGTSGPVCAYIRSDGMDIDALLGGNPDLSNELYYWSPTL